MNNIKGILLPEYFLLNPFGGDQEKVSARKLPSLGVVPVVGFNSDTTPEVREQLAQCAVPSAVFIDSLGGDLSCLQSPNVYTIARPEIIFPLSPSNLIYEIHTEEEAKVALDLGAKGLIIKGNEASGKIAHDSTFILFQKIYSQYNNIPVWLRGGIGLHNSAAAMALGAQGVVLEESCYLFPELAVPEDLQHLFGRLDGTETRELHGQRCYINMPYWPKELNKEHIDRSFFDQCTKLPSSAQNPIIVIGQAVGLAKTYLERFGTLTNFIQHLKWATESHLLQANINIKQNLNHNRFVQDFGVSLPIAQGPMTRVSDSPEFIHAVANEGALPFFALAMIKGPEAADLLSQTQSLLGQKPWGVGVLGFVDAELQLQQFQAIEKIHPQFILVAGGNSTLVKKYEGIGAHVFIHAPSEALLDIFLKDNVHNFVFEGRECGGHVGPLSSFVLWEKSICRLLKEDHLHNVSCFFAGGIHDAFSSAFVNTMAAPLVTRGAKVGLLMGTSYLYTEEAVRTKAIVGQYQQLCSSNPQTTLLESGPGHVIRCLNTPFAQQFHGIKTELLSSKIALRDLQHQLEALNIGRLRLASKGLKRTENGLEHSSTEEQLQDGLYMVGQVATLPQIPKSMASLHEHVTTGANNIIQCAANTLDEKRLPGGIAIIGMACIFPDAKNLNQYWQNILENRNAITEVSKERWDPEVFFDSQAKKGEKSNSKWGGFIPAIEFDPTEFGIPPQSLAAIDPAQLLSLQATKDALVDAGYWKNNLLDKENTAVIFGTEGGSELLLGYELRATIPRLFGELPPELDDALPSLTEDSFSGTLPNVISGRIANRLDFGARNFVVDAACASSMAAVDIACQELKSHRANLVVAGAVDLHNDLIDYLKFSSVGALSNDGSCKSFSEDANGIALGEGVGVLILKRLEDAIQDRDKIYSVIRGIGASSDGKNLGLTAPRKHGQKMAYERAYKEANINPVRVGLIEAHGTGTVVGDKVELESLSEFFQVAGSYNKSISLGSVKTQIGHTKCAAGLASIIKTSLALYHGVKPATQNLEAPNKAYQENHSPFEFQQQAAIWTDKQRVAGVSAFGFGGTNFHAVLENYTDSSSNHRMTCELWPCELFILRAADANSLEKQISELLFLIEKEPDIRLPDLAYTLATQNNFPIQWSFIATDRQDLLEKLRAIHEKKSLNGLYQVHSIPGKIAFLFSGQGSQRINMARELFVAFPQMREQLGQYPELQKIIFPPRSFDQQTLDRQKNIITRTENAQPLLGIVDLAIAKLLQEFGIHPDSLAGHSYGEIPALVFAGVIKESDLVSISSDRAQAILAAAGEDPGSMLALNISLSGLEILLEQFPDVFIANHNSHTQWVVAGATTAIHRFMAYLEKQEQAYKQLPVACAFHSPIIAAAENNFAAALAAYEFNTANTSLWSNTTSGLYPSAPQAIKQRLCEHLVKPVNFTNQLEAMYNDGIRLFIETGPGKILANLTKDIFSETVSIFTSIGDNGKGLTHLITMLAQYIATGRSLDFERFYAGRNVVQLDLPKLRAQRKSNVLWLLRGNRADPVFMPSPAHSAKEIIEPVSLLAAYKPYNNLQTTVMENSVKEKMILDYLANMRAMIEAQQNVMMSYFNEGQLPSQLSQAHVEKLVTAPPVHNLYPVTADVVANKMAMAVAPAPSIPQLESNDVISLHGTQSGNLSSTILKLISDKTGYPVEMLDLDMDLEADLSIDSIKRVEIVSTLKSQFIQDIPESTRDNLTQHLGTMKSINALISALESYIKPTATTPVHTNGIKGAAPAALPGKSIDFPSLLINIVSERTGYPHEMLDMEMDLEADLSIDSIKRTEIMSALQTSISAAGYTLDSQIIAQAATGKTLGQITASLASDVQRKVDIQVKKFQAITESTDDAVHRYQFELIESECGSAANSEWLRGATIGVFDDGSDGIQRLGMALAHAGATVENVSQATPDLTHLDGFVYADCQSSTRHLTSSELFSITKKLDHLRLRWFFTITDIDARIGQYTHPKAIFKQLRGTYGFINSLNKEWDAICREINVDEDNFSPEKLLREFYQASKSEPMVYYRNGKRFINSLQEAPWDFSSGKKLDLNINDKVLVTGGAQGITAEILQHMAQSISCHYILVGRTTLADPDLNKLSDTDLSRTQGELKVTLLKQEKFSSPKALENRASLLYKQSQIVLTRRKLEALGARVSYYCADLSTEEGIASLLGTIKQDFHKLDGIIHASGHLEDRLVIDKSPSSFDRVVATKLAPLDALLNEFSTSLKFCAFFSSVTSVFGNKGQIDYGTANAVLDQLANALHKTSGVRTIAINWGPWKGKGMIDHSLEQDFIRRGVTLIPLREGAKAFLDELLYGTGGQAILMTQVKDMTRAKEQF